MLSQKDIMHDRIRFLSVIKHMEETIAQYFKDPTKGLNINNTYRNLILDKHYVTMKQVKEAIQNMDK